MLIYFTGLEQLGGSAGGGSKSVTLGKQQYLWITDVHIEKDVVSICLAIDQSHAKTVYIYIYIWPLLMRDYYTKIT